MHAESDDGVRWRKHPAPVLDFAAPGEHALASPRVLRDGALYRMWYSRRGESYRIGFFLVGAYQEILGDIHNLFGDTDAVEVSADAGTGYLITQQRRGDTTDVMLDYVGYKLEDLRSAYRTRVEEAKLPADEAVALADALEAGLTGYTYLSDEPLS